MKNEGKNCVISKEKMMISFLCSIVGWFVGSILIFRLMRMVTTPLFKKLGYYQYWSSMFFTQQIAFNVYEFHMGTSYDFLFHNDSSKQTLEKVCEGLLGVCEAIESGNFSPNDEFYGTMYYFSDKTLQRFGFTVRNLNLLQRCFFFLNLGELSLLYSLQKKRLEIVNFTNVKIGVIDTKTLLQHKSLFERYLKQFRKEEELMVC